MPFDVLFVILNFAILDRQSNCPSVARLREATRIKPDCLPVVILEFDLQVRVPGTFDGCLSRAVWRDVVQIATFARHEEDDGAQWLIAGILDGHIDSGPVEKHEVRCHTHGNEQQTEQKSYPPPATIPS